MATLVLSAVGTLVGGPLGGAVGALIGRHVDAKIIGSPVREGPRLTELAVSTSSYGQPVPQIHGTMRVGGTIVWATDLVEHRSTSGGKGQPKTANYSYTTSFAVALSSRPIESIGRIWADGNLLRGAAGDLKVAGTLRIHTGHGDQPPDPLIASAEYGACPAFRGIAYAVFEDLDLTEFGNRIPALSFEVVAGSADIPLASLLEGEVRSDIALGGLRGYAIEGGSLASGLTVIDAVFPLTCDASRAQLKFLDPDRSVTAIELPDAVAAWAQDDFGGTSGRRSSRQSPTDPGPHALRYYDPARDYQPGVQRAVGPTPLSGQQTVEFPGVLAAETAQALAEQATQRARWGRERIAWRMAELDPAIVPGSVVTVPSVAGEWLVTGWEWREGGIELELLRRRATSSRSGGGAAGNVIPPADLLAGRTLLAYFELPPERADPGSARRAYIAAGSTGAARSVALFARQGSELVPTGGIARADALIGELLAPLKPSPCLRFEPSHSLLLSIPSASATLRNVSAETLASGANRLLLGAETLQFAAAEPLGGGNWRLSGLLRGRGGSEWAAQRRHEAGTRVVILDDRIVAAPVDPAIPHPPAEIAALGAGDSVPVGAELANAMASVTPPAPVHATARDDGAGGRRYSWLRRSRGSWAWLDTVEVPLAEERELYLVGVGQPDAPLVSWQVEAPAFAIAMADYTALAAEASGQPLWVRQIGTWAASTPTLLERLP